MKPNNPVRLSTVKHRGLISVRAHLSTGLWQREIQHLKEPYPPSTAHDKALDSSRQTYRPWLVTRLGCWEFQQNLHVHKTLHSRSSVPAQEQSTEPSPARGPCPSSRRVPGTRRCPEAGTARRGCPSVSAGTAAWPRPAGRAGTAPPGTPGTASPADKTGLVSAGHVWWGGRLTSIANETCLGLARLLVVSDVLITQIKLL